MKFIILFTFMFFNTSFACDNHGPSLFHQKTPMSKEQKHKLIKERLERAKFFDYCKKEKCSKDFTIEKWRKLQK